MIQNPFKYGGIVTGEYFCNRKQEIIKIQEAVRDGQNLVLISPRRWGKTSLMQQALNGIDRDTIVIYLDCFRYRSPAEFYSGLLKVVLLASESKLEALNRLIGKYLKKIIPSISFSPSVETELSVSVRLDEDPKEVDEILDLVAHLALEKGKRYVICIDEFQDIKNWKDGDKLLRKLRSHWQNHESVAYCLYGSKRHMMDLMFNNSSEPFYRFGEIIYLDKINKNEWVKFILQRFKATGKEISPDLALQLVDLADSHSYFVQFLARLCWSKTEDHMTDEILKSAWEELLKAEMGLFQKITERLSRYQLNYIRAIVDGHTKLTRNKVLKEYDLSSSANVVKMEKAMREYEILTYNKEEINFTEPYFKPLFIRHFIQ